MKDLPAGWRLISLKRILRKPLQYGATEAGDCYEPTYPRYIRITDFGGDGLLRDDTFVSLPFDLAKDYLLEDGDLLFARSGATAGKVYRFKGFETEACFAGYLIRASTDLRLCSSDFLYFVTQSNDYESWKDTIFTQATIPNIGADKYAYLPVPLPPLPEQRRIAAFLDDRCAAIDAAVKAKRDQIGLLEHLRDSQVEHAVLAGIGKAREHRTIGRDWIGSVPGDWTVVAVKRLLKRMDYGISESTSREGRFRVLKMGNISEGEIKFTELESVDAVDESLILDDGDIVYNRTNSHDQVGKSALIRFSKNEGITFASYLVRLRVNHRVLPEYLCQVLNCQGFLGFARKLAIPSVQQANLNSTRFGQLLVPLPQIEVQREIIAFVSKLKKSSDSVIQTIQAQIDTLTAYRKSLIHECVTGKRRIGEGSVPLPE